MSHTNKRPLTFALLLGFLAILLTALPLHAEQARDDGGKIIDLSEWRETPAQDTLFTTPLHAPGPIESIKTQTRDNVIHHEHIFFTEKKGRIFLQHVINAFFSNSVKTKIRDKDTFLEKLQSVPKEMRVSYTDPVEINHKRYPSGGYYSILTFAGSNRSCFIADGGYKMNQTIYDNDMGEYDTIMSMNYCDDSLNIDKLVHLVRRLEIIGKSIGDRKKYAEAVSQIN